MKIVHVGAWVMALSLWGCIESQKDGAYKIEGTITGLSDTVHTLYLRLSDGERLFTVDSTSLREGRFVIESTLDYPQMVFLQVGRSNKIINLFAEGTVMEVRADIDELDQTTVRGSKTHSQLMEFQKMMEPYEKEYNDIVQQYRQASSDQDMARLAQLDVQYNALWERQEKAITDFLSDKNDSFLTPYLIRRQLSYQLDGEELSRLIADIDPAVHVSGDYRYLAERARILERVAIGSKAPDFTLKDPYGNPVSLSSLEGQYVLIDFWASWCAPCRRENPNVVRIYNEFSSQGFEILGVSLDEDRDRWLAAIEEDNLGWRHVSDLRGWSSAAGRLYGVNSIPHTVLIDPEGVIVSKNLSGDALYEKLEALLADKGA